MRYFLAQGKHTEHGEKISQHFPRWRVDIEWERERRGFIFLLSKAVWYGIFAAKNKLNVDTKNWQLCRVLGSLFVGVFVIAVSGSTNQQIKSKQQSSRWITHSSTRKWQLMIVKKLKIIEGNWTPKCIHHWVRSTQNVSQPSVTLHLLSEV